MSRSRNMIGWFIKTYLHKPINIIQFLSRAKIKKMFNIALKCFNTFNNKPPSSWVAHIRRNFLTCYSCSYYSSMVIHQNKYAPLKWMFCKKTLGCKIEKKCNMELWIGNLKVNLANQYLNLKPKLRTLEILIVDV